MMPRGFFSSLRMRLIMIVMLSLIPMILLVLHLCANERTRAVSDARLRAIDLTQEIGRFQETMIHKAFQCLQDLSHVPQFKRLDAQKSGAILTELRKENEGFASFGAAGPDGILFASWPENQNTINIAATDWYKRFEKGGDHIVSGYTFCRISHKPSIVVAHPVFDHDGHSSLVLVAGLDLRYLNRHLAEGRYPPGTTVTIADHRGLVLARYPDPDRFVGKPVITAALFKAARKRLIGVMDASGPDGVARIYAFSSIGHGANAEHVVVGIPRTVALAGPNRDWHESLWLLLAVAGLALIGTWFVGDIYVVQRVKSILRVMEQVAGGNLSARIGGTRHPRGELNQIAKAFDRMAERLEQREQEAEQVADDKIRRSRAMLQLIIDRMPIACIVWDPQFRTTLWNPAAEKIFGFSETDALGKRPVDFIVSETLEPHVDRIWNQLITGAGAPGSVNENRTRSGRTIICEWSNTPLKGPDDTVIGVLSMAQDITERKKAEEGLRHLTRLLKILSECNQTLVRAQEESDLLAQICRIIVETGEYRMAWVGDAGCDAPKTVYPADRWNPNDLSLQSMADPEESPDHVDPIATAVQKTLPSVFRVVPEDSGPFAGGSVIGLPLMAADHAFGGLCIYADTSDAFADEDLGVLLELADDLAFGIETLRTRTELRKTLSALQESETRFRNLYDDAPVAYQALDPEGNVLEINKKWLRMLGYEREEVLGRWLGDFMASNYRVGFSERLAHQNAVGDTHPVVSGMLTRDGRTIAVEVEKRTIYDEHGKVKRSYGILRDITDVQEAETAIQALVEGSVALTGSDYFDNIVRRLCRWLGVEYALVTEIVDPSHFRLIAMQADGRLRHDPSVYPLSGVPSARVLTDGFCVFPERVQALFPEARGQLGVTDVEGYIGAPLRDRVGHTIGVLSAMSRHPLRPPRRAEDVMNILAAKASAELERRRIENDKDKMERKLRQAQKMEAIGTLAGGIAHDFNNILSVLFGYTEMSLLEVPENSHATVNLKNVIKALHRARDLVQQILSFSRKNEETYKPFQLGPILKEAVKLLRAALPSTIRMRTLITASQDVILGDPTQVHQVLMNLCTNAAQAMEETGGVLEVHLSAVRFDPEDPERPADLKAGPYLRLTVRDSGPGIPEAVRERIFEPYFTTKGVGKGTGLGLAVVYGIAQKTGGTVTVESESGAGTAFHVFFPEVETKPVAVNGSAPKALGRGEETVLLVDDEPSILDSTGQLLTHLGYKVVPHTNGLDALNAFRSGPDVFDLVITDQTMPRMTGLDLAKEILAIRPEMPIVLCTGFSETVNPEKAKALGIREMLVKPVPLQEIASRIRSALE